MTEPTSNNYSARTPAWGYGETYIPKIMQAIDFLASMTEGQTFDVSRLVNAIKYDSGVRPFVDADYQAQSRMLSDFRYMTSTPAHTLFESLVQNGTAYMYQDKGVAEQTMRQMSVMGGGFRAFGFNGLSVADISGWDTSLGGYNEALARTMADYYNLPPDNNVSRGERVALMAKMMGGDDTLIRQNAMARDIVRQAQGMNFDIGLNDNDPNKWENALKNLDTNFKKFEEQYQRQRDNLEAESQDEKLTPEERNLRKKEIAGLDTEYEEATKLKEAFADLAKQLHMSEKDLAEFSAAASDWGKIFKTDAVSAVDKVSNALGIDAATAFTPQTFGMMTRMTQHSAQMSGRSVEHVLGLTGETAKLLAAHDLAPDLAMAIANNAVVSGMSGNGYRNLRTKSERVDMTGSAQMFDSEQGAIYMGTMATMIQNTPNDISGAARRTHEYFMAHGVSMASARAITGNNGLGINELKARRESFDVQEQLAANPEWIADLNVDRVRNDTNVYLRHAYGLVGNRRVNLLQEQNRLSNLIGEDVSDVIANTSYTKMVDRFGGDIASQIVRFRDARWAYAGRRITRSGRLGKNLIGATQEQFNRYMAAGQYRQSGVKLRQAKVRSQLQADYTSGGFFRTLTTAATLAPEITLGDMASIVNELTLNPDTIDLLSTASVDKEGRKVLTDMFSKEQGGNAYDDRFVAGIRAFDDLKRSGVNTKTAIDKSGLTNFGFTADDKGVLKFDSKLINRDEINKDIAADKESKASHSSYKDHLIEEIKKDDTYQNRENAAKHLALHDMWESKNRYDSVAVYTDKQREALAQAEKALGHTDPMSKEAMKEANQAIAAMQQAFKTNNDYTRYESKARDELGAPLTGAGFERMIFESVSNILKTLTSGEGSPISVKITNLPGQ